MEVAGLYELQSYLLSVIRELNELVYNTHTRISLTRTRQVSECTLRWGGFKIEEKAFCFTLFVKRKRGMKIDSPYYRKIMRLLRDRLIAIA